MKATSRLFELNIAVFLISTSGILGRLIQLSPELVIFYRCVIAALVLYLFIRIKKIDLFTERSHLKYILSAGILMAVHWVSYFYSLKLSSIAIAMLTLHTFPVMTSILEPLVLKTRFEKYHLLLAILVLIGIWIILPSFDLSDSLVIATLCGLVSALSYSLRNIWTRKIMIHYNGSMIMFYQLIIMAILLSPFLFIFDSSSLDTDWSYLLLLAFFTTVLGHTLLVGSLKHFSAITVSLLSSIIPIYGILWGVFFLNEIPSLKTLLGGCFIMASFVSESLINHKRLKDARKQED